MTVYRKKPEYVEAWRIGHMLTPGWALQSFAAGQIETSVLGDRFNVATPAGRRYAAAGDWIINSGTGLQVVTADAFALDYEMTPPMGGQTGDASTLANKAEYEATSAPDVHATHDGVQDAANNAGADEPDLAERRRLTAMGLAVAIGDLRNGVSAVARAKEIEAYLRGDQ